MSLLQLACWSGIFLKEEEQKQGGLETESGKLPVSQRKRRDVGVLAV